MKAKSRTTKKPHRALTGAVTKSKRNKYLSIDETLWDKLGTMAVSKHVTLSQLLGSFIEEGLSDNIVSAPLDTNLNLSLLRILTALDKSLFSAIDARAKLSRLVKADMDIHEGGNGEEGQGTWVQ